MARPHNHTNMPTGPQVKLIWAPEEDQLLVSLVHVHADGFRSRGSQSWKDIAATMTEQAPCYGLPSFAYTSEEVQARWFALKLVYEQQGKDDIAQEIAANRGSLVLPPLREEDEYGEGPMMLIIESEAQASGPPGFEQLCKDRKDRKGKGKEV